MDISATRKEGFSAWVKFGEDVCVLVKHISREELREIYKKATKVTFTNHQKGEEFDPIKADSLLGRAAILNWSGITDGEAEFPCTPENIDLLMRRHNAFAKFINDTCVDIDYLLREELESTKKN